jgi:elongation factor G
LKSYDTAHIRNVALAGHSSSGKTSLTEAMLYLHNHVERMGKTEDGNTQSDFLTEETSRKISISTSVLPVETGEVKVNVIDLPGFRDFIGDMMNGMTVSAGLVVIIDALGGVEVGTEFALELAEKLDLPVAFWVNKLNKENASFDKALENLKAYMPNERFLPITIPVGAEEKFHSVIDLIKMKETHPDGQKLKFSDIPSGLADTAAGYREAIMDEAAANDEALAEKFLGGEELSPEEILRGLKAGFIARDYHPVFAGDAIHAIGVQSLLDFVELAFPNPAEAHGIHMLDRETGETAEDQAFTEEGSTTAFVFKTLTDRFGQSSFVKVIHGCLKKDTVLTNLRTGKDERVSHVYVQRGHERVEVEELHAGDIGVLLKLSSTVTNDTLGDPKEKVVVAAPPYPKPTVIKAVHAKNSGDEEKLGALLHRTAEQDPTITVRRDPELAQTLLAGMGDMQLDVLISSLKTEKVEAELENPRTPFRETITKTAEGTYRHKKQSGGKGQFGEVSIRLSPGERGSDLDFQWKIVGGVIPTKFEPSVRKGIEAALQRGIVAGYKVVDVIAAAIDGKTHDVDSSDMAFQLASSMCFRQVARTANPIILEPIYRVNVTVPETYMGDVMGDMSSRRGRILGQEMSGNKVTVEAHVPLAEMYEYSRDLRSMTQGRGTFEMEYDHYDRVPGDIQAKLVAAHDAGDDEEH